MMFNIQCDHTVVWEKIPFEKPFATTFQVSFFDIAYRKKIFHNFLFYIFFLSFLWFSSAFIQKFLVRREKLKSITSTWFTFHSFFSLSLYGKKQKFSDFFTSFSPFSSSYTDTKRAARHLDLFCYQFYAQIYSRRISFTIRLLFLSLSPATSHLFCPL